MKTSASHFLVGVARRNISPLNAALLVPTGMPRTEPTFGVFDPLYVEAMALSLGDEAAVLLTADLRLWPTAWVADIRESIADRIGIEPWHVLFSATHNHCSSPAAANRSPEAVAAVEAANRRIVEAAKEACCEAFENRRPAEMAAGHTLLSEPIGQNRRIRFADGICINGWGAGTIVPPGQRIVGAAGPDSARVDFWCAREPGAEIPFALLVSYATHPHFYELPAFSGEFSGAAKRHLVERLPGATVLYANHAGGDIDIHRVHPMPDGSEARRTWFRESADHRGARLAETVLAVLSSANYVTPHTLRHDRFTTESRCQTPDLRSFNIIGLALDNVAFLSLPGELFHELGLRIHAGSPFADLCLLGYNGIGRCYLPPPLGFEQGGFEVQRGPAPPAPDGDALTPLPIAAGARMETGLRLVEEALALLHRLRWQRGE